MPPRNRSLGGTALKWMFEGLSHASRRTPMARAYMSSVHIERDVAYHVAGAPHHRLDVYSTRPGPALLYLHGGAFRILSKDTHWLMAGIFAKAGYVVFNANYRLAPLHRYPAALEDAARAYAWVVDNATRYGADPSQLVVAGESAGANLSLALTLSACFERSEPFAKTVFDTGVVPKAALPMCGILQVSDVARFGRRKPHLGRFTADRLFETEDGYLHGVTLGELPLCDPLLLLESKLQPERPLPPMYSAVGTADPLLDDTRRLARALERRGVPHQVSYFPGELHAFHALAFRRAARACWREQLEFLSHAIGQNPAQSRAAVFSS